MLIIINENNNKIHLCSLTYNFQHLVINIISWLFIELLLAARRCMSLLKKFGCRKYIFLSI